MNSLNYQNKDVWGFDHVHFMLRISLSTPLISLAKQKYWIALIWFCLNTLRDLALLTWIFSMIMIYVTTQVSLTFLYLSISFDFIYHPHLIEITSANLGYQTWTQNFDETVVNEWEERNCVIKNSTYAYKFLEAWLSMIAYWNNSMQRILAALGQPSRIDWLAFINWYQLFKQLAPFSGTFARSFIFVSHIVTVVTFSSNGNYADEQTGCRLYCIVYKSRS